MKKISPKSTVTLILILAAIALIAVGVKKESIALVFSGFGTTFASIAIGSLVESVINTRKSFPLRNDPTQKKMRAARYLSAAASVVITIGIVMVFVGFFMNARGDRFFLYPAWAVLAVGIAMAVTGAALSTASSKHLPAENSTADTVIPPSVKASIPYSPDPVISRILANPYVLLDERIRQLHEVQNLLQYPEIQQVFFEPERLYTLFANARVGELLNIVRDWVTQNNADEIFAAAEQRRSSGSPGAAVRNEKPVRKTVSVKIGTGLTVFIVLFASVFVFVIAVTLFGVIFGSRG